MGGGVTREVLVGFPSVWEKTPCRRGLVRGGLCEGWRAEKVHLWPRVPRDTGGALWLHWQAYASECIRWLQYYAVRVWPNRIWKNSQRNGTKSSHSPMWGNQMYFAFFSLAALVHKCYPRILISLFRIFFCNFFSANSSHWQRSVEPISWFFTHLTFGSFTYTFVAIVFFIHGFFLLNSGTVVWVFDFGIEVTKASYHDTVGRFWATPRQRLLWLIN